MQIPSLPLQSLKTRVTLMTLGIVVLTLFVLATLVKGQLREELLLFTGEQQRSALQLLTSQVKHGLDDRIDILQSVAKLVTPKELGSTARLQSFLLERPYLVRQFNAGMVLWSPSGTVLADTRLSESGPAVTLLDSEELATVLKNGQVAIGAIRPDAKGQPASFSMAVPVRNPQGETIGALGGAIRLDQDNFLSQLTDHRYGRTGNFFLIDAKSRQIFSTSDKQRLMEVLPGPGVSAWIDRFVQGFEGTARVVNPHGVEVLVSVQQIPMARWYASVTLSPEEPFALIATVGPRARLTALVMAMLCLVLIWWMLRRQLAPMTAAVTTLDRFIQNNQAPQALPVVRQDEVGQLVGGFNRLLETLGKQQKVLHDREVFIQTVLNSVTAEIAVLDPQGVILAVNHAWLRYSAEDALATAHHSAPITGVGSDYLAACQAIDSDPTTGDALNAFDGIRAVLNAQLPHFYMEYPSHTPQQQRWLSMSVTPLSLASQQGAVVSLADITERVHMEHQVRELAFYDALTELPNRRLAMERLAQQFARARRTQHRLAVLFIDLDHFKPINDELGHEVGDWLLKAVARRIQNCLRESDTVARMGGDEFVVLLPDLQTIDDAITMAEKIRLALVQEFVAEQGAPLRISSSIGVAVYPDHGQTETDLLRLGDEAMYQAKKEGRNAVHLCGSSTRGA